ncbi:MAG: bacterioferritin [Terracidiphilus sp.]|jgi:bacterioferritin
MKGNEKVIAALNKAVHEELVALSEYFVHAEMNENWKYGKIAKQIKKFSIQEMKHAEHLIERILFLEGTPNLAGPTQLKIGKTVKEQFENDLAAELDAVKMYNEFVALAREAGDHGSADLFLANLKDEEEHADWLDAQLGLINELGVQTYLSKQLDGE